MFAKPLERCQRLYPRLQPGSAALIAMQGMLGERLRGGVNCADKSCVKTTLRRAAKAPSTWEHQSATPARLDPRSGCGCLAGLWGHPWFWEERQAVLGVPKQGAVPTTATLWPPVSINVPNIYVICFYKCTQNMLLGAGWCSQEEEGSL